MKKTDLVVNKEVAKIFEKSAKTIQKWRKKLHHCVHPIFVVKIGVLSGKKPEKPIKKLTTELEKKFQTGPKN